MLDFWDWEKSPYIKEKLRRHHSIGKPHALRQYNNIKKHWRPYLETKLSLKLQNKIFGIS